MFCNRRNLVVLVTLVFGGSLVIYGSVPRSIFQEQNGTLSRNLHLKFNSQGRRLLAFKEKGSEDQNSNATHSIAENSLLISDSLKNKEDVTKAAPHVKSVRGRFKRQTRRKRDVPKEKLLPWQFKMIISRPNTPKAEAEIPGPKLRMEKSGKPLSISLQVKGNDIDDSYSELNHAWDSVENFMRQLFGGNTEELSERGYTVFVDFNGLPSKFHSGDFSPKDNADDETLSQQQKDPRFLLGFLGLGEGSNAENPPIDKGNEGTLNKITTTEETPVTDTSTTKTPSVNEESKGALDNITTTDELPVADNTILEVLDDFPHTRPFGELGTSEKSLDMVLKDGFTTDDSSTFSTLVTESNNENSAFTPSEQELKEFGLIRDELEGHSITSEQLRELCIDLLQQRRQKFPRNLEEDFESSGSVGLNENDAVSEQSVSTRDPITSTEPSRDPITSTELSRDPITSTELSRDPITSTEPSTEQRPSNIGFISSLLHRITGGRFGQSSSSVNTNSASDSSDLETQNRNARILFNFNSVFGSGRSAVELNGFENIEFDDMNSNPARNKTGKITFSDCVAVFRRIVDENSQTESLSLSSSQTESTSASRTITEFQGVGHSEEIKDLIGNPITDSPVDNKDRIVNIFVFGNEVNIGSGSLEVPEERKQLLSRDFLTEGSGRNEIGNSQTDQNTEDPSTSPDTSQDPRIFPGFFNFGSGSRNIEDQNTEDPSTSPDASQDPRIFPGFFNFGSGGRNIEDQITEDPSTSPDASQDPRIFPGFFNFGSGGRNFEESSEFQTDNSLHVTKDERIFGGLLEFGSGVRQRQEKIEPTGADFPTGEILLEEASVSELSILDEHNDIDLDITSRKMKTKFITIDEGVRTQKTNQEHGVYSVYENQDALNSDRETSQRDHHSKDSLDEGSGGGIDSTNVERKRPDCVVCVVENGTDTLIRCTECPSDRDADSGKVNAIESRQMDVSGETTPKVISKEPLPDPTNGPLQTKSLIESGRNESVLLGKLFLNGNNENDQIDLVPETERTITAPLSSVSPRNARRGRLLDDGPQDPQELEHGTDLVRTERTADSEGHRDSSSEITSTFGETTALEVDPVQNETFSDRFGQAWSDQNESATAFSGTKLPIPPSQESSGPQTTHLPLITSPTRKNKRTNTEKRECFHSDQCNKSLNERCVAKGITSICDCSKYFARDPTTGKCVEPFLMKAQLKFPKEDFHKDFDNDSSNRYHRMRKDALKTMKLLIGYDQDLLDTLVKVDVADFEEGSLVIDFDFSFLKRGNSTVLEMLQKVERTITEALKDEYLTKRMPLKTRDARVLKITTVTHRCDSKELNYCSPNAKCLPLGGNFKCQCKDGYLDKSREEFPGEVCVEFCPPNYCGENGYCDMNSEGERRCLCRGWYLGEKCQIPGPLVIGGFAICNVMVVLVIVVIVCLCRCRRRRRSHYYGSENPVAMGGRTSFSSMPVGYQDTIVMNDMVAGPSAKYVSRSTPLSGIPNIKVTSPSIVGSSVSYDFDSTFERSMNIEMEDKSVRL